MARLHFKELILVLNITVVFNDSKVVLGTFVALSKMFFEEVLTMPKGGAVLGRKNVLEVFTDACVYER